MKVSIIGGAGLIGSTAAFVMAQRQLADEICLVDVKEKVAKSHEMDMGQAVFGYSKVRITSGNIKKIEGSEIIVLTVGQTDVTVSSRMERLEGSLNILQGIAPKIKEYAENAVVITATNPVDVINSMLRPMIDFDPSKLIGYSINDTYRFRWAISKILSVDFHDIEAIVLGEHGELQCPIYSQVKVKGEKIKLSDVQKQAVSDLVEGWFAEYQALQSGRTSGWLSGVTLADMVEAILKPTGKIFPCSVIDEDGISIGRAAILGPAGVEKVIDPGMSEEEYAQWQASKQKIAGIITSLHRGD